MLKDVLNNYRQIKVITNVKLEDFLRSQDQDSIDRNAKALLDLWPFMQRFKSDEPSGVSEGGVPQS